MKGHSWGEGVETKAATTSVPGIMTYTCAACGATREDEIPVLEEEYGYDVNADGTTDIRDLIALMKHVNGEKEAADLVAADANKDGYIDILDVIRLCRFLGLYGDVNEDGYIDARDATQVIRFLNGLPSVLDRKDTAD